MDKTDVNLNSAAVVMCELCHKWMYVLRCSEVGWQIEACSKGCIRVGVKKGSEKVKPELRPS